MVVYWDILLFINLVINGLILFLTSVASGSRVSWLRICFGAMLGAVYVMTGELAPLLQEPFAKAALSLLLILAVFGYHSWRTLLFTSAVFYLISFAIGGAVLGWLGFWQDASSQSRFVSLGEVSGGVLIGAAAIFFCLRRTMERASRLPQMVRVKVICAKRCDTFYGLVDTGNTLASPLRRTPVIVAERSSVPALVGKAHTYFSGREESEWVRDFALCPDELWQSRVTALPYRTIGEKGKMLLGLRVDGVVIEAKGMRYRSEDCIVAVTDKKLSANGAYTAIVPGRLLTEGEIEEGKREWAS